MECENSTEKWTPRSGGPTHTARLPSIVVFWGFGPVETVSLILPPLLTALRFLPFPDRPPERGTGSSRSPPPARPTAFPTQALTPRPTPPTLHYSWTIFPAPSRSLRGQRRTVAMSPPMRVLDLLALRD